MQYLKIKFKVFPLLICFSFSKYPHFLIIEVLNLQAKCVQPKAVAQHLIDFNVNIDSRGLFCPLCMCLTLCAHHYICLSYHLSSEALPVCTRVIHLLSIKT